jgi:molecular chaperone GrpE
MSETTKDNLETEPKVEAEIVDNLESNNLKDDDLENGMPGIDPDMMAQLEEFQKKLQRAEDLEREVAEWKTRYVRLQQDFENYRRRTGEDVVEAKSGGEASAVESLLPIFDDLSRAIDAGVKDPATLLPGLSSVRENFLKTVSSFGVEQVPGKGEIFDPMVHEALGVQSGDEDDKILEVFQTGFVLKGKLIRPARVIVSKKSN